MPRAEDDEAQQISEVIGSLMQHTSAAMAYRKKNQIPKAIKHMEKALRESEGHEQGHPALAVEAARARLNLSAMLASADRHLEALIAIKEAQRGLSSVLAWAGDCGEGDQGVMAIADEARTLVCAATVAEAIELESRGSEETLQQPWPPPEMEGLHTQIYMEANVLAEEGLHPQHPMATLARRMAESCARAVCAPAALEASVSSSSSSKKHLREHKPLPQLEAAAAGARSRVGQPLDGPGQAQASFGGADEDCGDSPRAVEPLASDGQSGRRRSAVGQNKKKRSAPHKKGEKTDLFSEFTRDIEAEKLMRVNTLFDTLEHDRRRLAQMHRTTQLTLEQSTDLELKDKKYTHQGHKVMMESFLQANRSRSDPSLLKQARASRTSPEVLEIQKMHKKLYVKPPTPPPPPKQEKPKIDAGVAELFRRPPKPATPPEEL